jgi:hypothetical protein
MTKNKFYMEFVKQGTHLYQKGSFDHAPETINVFLNTLEEKKIFVVFLKNTNNSEVIVNKRSGFGIVVNKDGLLVLPAPYKLSV